MNLALDLTENELQELRRRTNGTTDADAVSRAAREFLRISRARELTSISGEVDYDENSWRSLDEAELAERPIMIEPEDRLDA